MEIGLLVCSDTGHAAKLAVRSAAPFQALGQSVKVLPLIPSRGVPHARRAGAAGVYAGCGVV